MSPTVIIWKLVSKAGKKQKNIKWEVIIWISRSLINYTKVKTVSQLWLMDEYCDEIISFLHQQDRKSRGGTTFGNKESFYSSSVKSGSI